MRHLPPLPAARGIWKSHALSGYCALAAALLLAGTAGAGLAEDNSQSEKPRRQNSEQADAPKTQTKITFERPLVATQLIGSAVTVTDEQKATIADVLFDPMTGYAPVVLVSIEQDDKVHPVPLNWLRSAGDSGWKVENGTAELLRAAQVELSNRPIRGTRVQEWLGAMKAEIPWEDARATTPGDFELLSSVIGRQVENREGDSLGRIITVVIDADTSRLAYTVVRSREPASEQARPSGVMVPLSAFVLSERKGTWLLELTQKELLEYEQVKPDSVPNELPRAWIEYVSVRYGSDVQGGIQPVHRAAQKDDPDTTRQ